MRRQHDSERGQSIVEFALLLPILAVLLAAILEFGLAFDADLAVEAASREGARIAAVIGNGGTMGTCPNATAEATVDPRIVASVQASLTSAGVNMSSVVVTIYQSDASGNPVAGKSNTYTWSGSAFTRSGGSWTACGRHDGTFDGGIYDPVGVRVQYHYVSRTGVLAFFSGGLNMTAKAVMPIGPPWNSGN